MIQSFLANTNRGCALASIMIQSFLAKTNRGCAPASIMIQSFLANTNRGCAPASIMIQSFLANTSVKKTISVKTYTNNTENNSMCLHFPFYFSYMYILWNVKKHLAM